MKFYLKETEEMTSWCVGKIRKQYVCKKQSKEGDDGMSCIFFGVFKLRESPLLV